LEQHEQNHVEMLKAAHENDIMAQPQAFKCLGKFKDGLCC